jgi:hypothetical protein
MEPLDDAARALVGEAKRRGKWSGLPHRAGGGGGSQVTPGQYEVGKGVVPA